MQNWSGERVATNGIELNVRVVGEGPLILLIHGWPEMGYSWRHQVPPLVEAGYKVAVPDVRGYGLSDRPAQVEDYRMKEMTADMSGLISALSADNSAVVIGHDWGAPIAWTTAILYPEQVRAVGGLSVPYTGRGKISSTKLWQQIYKDRFFYQNYFQEVGVAEAELEQDMRSTLRKIYFSGSGDGVGNLPREATHKTPNDKYLTGMPEPEPFPAWLSEQDLDFYVKHFEISGMRGPLNRYRCQNLDWKELPQLSELKVTQPACFIAGSKEPVLSFVPDIDMVAIMREKWVPDLRLSTIIDGAGHWVQQESPDEVNQALLQFLEQI